MRVRRLATSAALLGLAAAGWAGAARADSAIFAGGCFWCVESDFDHVAGVTATTSGYIGGTVPNPTYEQVSHGGTGHYEAVKIDYDPSVVSYDQLLQIFFRTVDPLDPDGQFCDQGASYRTAIFPQDGAEAAAAEAAKADAAGALGQTVYTAVLPGQTFYPAEDYHQDFYLKNPVRYEYYRYNCGRDERVDEIWGADARAGLG